MKTLILWLSIMGLTACAPPEMPSNDRPPIREADEQPSAKPNDDNNSKSPAQPLKLSSDGDVMLVLEDFQKRQTIKSPLQLRGKVRRDWFFEGSFPITLMTLEDEIVKASYASGPWLDPLPGQASEAMEGDDVIPFSASIEFEPPAEKNVGKIRFAKANPSGLPEKAEAVEVKVQWP